MSARLVLVEIPASDRFAASIIDFSSGPGKESDSAGRR
jgi:hypothetical protein